nr:putative integron gene cassette protein [uncultured bacterium]
MLGLKYEAANPVVCVKFVVIYAEACHLGIGVRVVEAGMVNEARLGTHTFDGQQRGRSGAINANHLDVLTLASICRSDVLEYEYCLH